MNAPRLNLKPGFNEFKSAHYIIKVPDSTETYSMHPVVPHCRGSSVPEARAMAGKEAEKIYLQHPEYKENGIPADEAHFSDAPEQPERRRSREGDGNRLIRSHAPDALPNMIAMWRSWQRPMRTDLIDFKRTEPTTRSED